MAAEERCTTGGDTQGLRGRLLMILGMIFTYEQLSETFKVCIHSHSKSKDTQKAWRPLPVSSAQDWLTLQSRWAGSARPCAYGCCMAQQAFSEFLTKLLPHITQRSPPVMSKLTVQGCSSLKTVTVNLEGPHKQELLPAHPDCSVGPGCA